MIITWQLLAIKLHAQIPSSMQVGVVDPFFRNAPFSVHMAVPFLHDYPELQLFLLDASAVDMN